MDILQINTTRYKKLSTTDSGRKNVINIDERRNNMTKKMND